MQYFPPKRYYLSRTAQVVVTQKINTDIFTVLRTRNLIRRKKVNSPAIRREGTWGERIYSSYSFTSSALEGGWVISVTPWPRFTPGERIPRYPLYRRLGGPYSRSEIEVRGQILCFCRGSNLNVVHSVARHYTDWDTPATVNGQCPTKFVLRMKHHHRSLENY
jgi:hypothetical protein